MGFKYAQAGSINDVTVFRLNVKEHESYTVFGRLSIQHDDGDAQNATVKLTHDDGALLVDRVDVRIPGNSRHSMSLQGTLRVDTPKILDIRCSTFRGSANQSSLFAVQVTDLKFD